MKYLLDSNIIIALARGDNADVVGRAAACEEGDMVTSAIAFGEVLHGSVRKLPPTLEDLAAFVEEVPVLDFDAQAAKAYASITFKRASFDRLIAAHALSQNLIVVTDNEVDFQGIAGLTVENWTKPA
jgi:tRNA(fMet)-specific endonuclease VapC